MRGYQLSFFWLLVPLHQTTLYLQSCIDDTLARLWFADSFLLFREEPISFGCVLLLNNLRLRLRGCLPSWDSALQLSLLASGPASRQLIADLRFECALLGFFYLPELVHLLLLLLKFLVLLLEPVNLSLDEILFLGLVSLNAQVLWRVLRGGCCVNFEGFGRLVLESHAAGHTSKGSIQIRISVQSVLAVSWWVSAGLGGALDYNLAKVIRIP